MCSFEFKCLKWDQACRMTKVYDLFSFKQLIQEPTRVSLATSSFINHIATMCTKNIVDARGTDSLNE